MKDKLTNKDIVDLRNYIEKLEDFVLENGSESDLPNILEQHKVKETISYLLLNGLNTPQKAAHENDWILSRDNLFGTEVIAYTCGYCGRKVYEATPFCASCGHLMLNYKQIMDEIKEFGEPKVDEQDKEWDWYTEKGYDDSLDEAFDENIERYSRHRELTSDEIAELFTSGDEINEEEFVDEVKDTNTDSEHSLGGMLSSDEINQLLGGDGKEDELSRIGQAYGLNLRTVEKGVYKNKQKHWAKVNLSSFAKELPEGYTILGSNTDKDGMGYAVSVIAQNIENYNKVVTEYVDEIMKDNFGLSIAKSGCTELMGDTKSPISRETLDRCLQAASGLPKEEYVEASTGLEFDESAAEELSIVKKTEED